MNLEEIAKLIKTIPLIKKEQYLLSLGRKQHIKFETGESSRLSKENPERFIRVGSQTLDKSEFTTEAEYERACISNASFLYEKFPLIFEFYDELMNGNTYSENLEPKGRKGKK